MYCVYKPLYREVLGPSLLYWSNSNLRYGFFGEILLTSGILSPDGPLKPFPELQTTF